MPPRNRKQPQKEIEQMENQELDQQEQEEAELLAARQQELDELDELDEQAESDGGELEGTAEPDGDGSTDAEPQWLLDEDGNQVLDDNGEPMLMEPEKPSPFAKASAPEGSRAAGDFVPDPQLVEILHQSFSEYKQKSSDGWYTVPATYYGKTRARTELYIRKTALQLGYGLSAPSKNEDSVTFQARVKKTYS